MVYCGKLSKNCNPCHLKHTKCNRAMPSCSQCRHVGRVCAYRDEQDLLFRDETT
ncbi:hypothetical protein K469DRAFT_717222 [Zopfia rhizophila CBS 207.26]|uniref:Zn(2)-C6 fungal-type domain-containing protein n=1 Tax=Zopfia rhizophila CBS 207.26 TaxID=1314779 RepID=A0A6A6EPF4_9PEZI|nr:hypothetical protein K469DRAFT_717222 [Zopfia rhizophila CBS 207.26]